MEKTLQDLTRQLLALAQSAADERVLPQEMVLIQEKAFEVQEKMMAELEQAEEKANDIRSIQNIFQIREDVWDIMNNLAIREAEVKAKFGLKEEVKPAKHHCCCHHHHEEKHECCCGHHHEDEHECCCKNKKTTKTKCCSKKEKKTCRKK